MGERYPEIDEIETAARAGDSDLTMTLLYDLRKRIDSAAFLPSEVQFVARRLSRLRIRLEAVAAGVSDALTDINEIIESSQLLESYDSEGNRQERSRHGAVSVRF